MIENEGSMQDEPTTAAQAAAQSQEMARPKRNSLSPRELLRRLSDKPAMSTAQRERGETRWGLAAVVVLAVLGLVAASIYIFTPGQSRFTAYFDEAGQIKSGDSVRVAGVPVGSVKNVSLEKDRVAVEMSIRRGVFIGEDSRADAKMLTVVGGNFIDITSVGSKPMKGDMGKDSTSVPYSLTKTFSLVQPKLEKIDVTPLRNMLVEVHDGFDRHPGALRRNLETLASMVTNINTRQDEFGSMLNLASEYTSQVALDGDIMTTLAQNLADFVTEFQTYGVRFAYVLKRLADLLERVKGVVLEYDTTIDPLIRQVDAIGRKFGPLLTRFEPMIEQGRDYIKRLENMVQPDGSIRVDHSGIVVSTDYCLPMAGVKC
jgi:phospholipid/cholesterol/gamma-HCH transport system substrate-binding protein